VPQHKIVREYLHAHFNHQDVPVVRLYYGGMYEFTVAFATSYRLPLLPVELPDGGVEFAVLATVGKEVIRVWSNEWVTGCELHNVDMSYPRIEMRGGGK
jgi:hypothetical protein